MDILVTGHTGFKGSWLCLWLQKTGHTVSGLSLPGNVTEPNLYTAARVKVENDYRMDLSEQRYWPSDFFDRYDKIFHLAAQPIVSEGYSKPLDTFYANTVGTMNLLEGIRKSSRKPCVLVVTTDKVYEPTTERAKETDRLGGTDMYSASKAAVELMCRAYVKAFGMRITTVRAGNCIGGGDWGTNRLFSDMARYFSSNGALSVRNPESIRPWQHVFDVVRGYARTDIFPDTFNFGPWGFNERTVEAVVKYARLCWGGTAEPKILRELRFPETETLRLDSTKAVDELGWAPRWNIETAIEKTVEWYKAFYAGDDMRAFSLKQIEEYDG